jgi:P2-related tail formation protein
MLKSRLLGSVICVYLALSTSASPSRAAGCEDTIARHMVGEAMLAAQFVAAAEKTGMTPGAINAVLKDIAAKSAIEEFWITDSSGHAYLTNTGIDFTFSADAKKQPQASAFWPLITGAKTVVIQNARKREIDNKIFKFVGVAGVDKPRIVQVGVSAANLCK